MRPLLEALQYGVTWIPIRSQGDTGTGHARFTATGSCSMWAWGHSTERAGSWRGGLWTRGLLWTWGSVGAHVCSCKFGISVARMTRGKQKIEAQKRSAERNEKPKGSQIEARNAGLKTVCSVCKAPLANYKQLVDHFGSKHPKETVPPGPSS